jgi:hypothetical protein
LDSCQRTAGFFTKILTTRALRGRASAIFFSDFKGIRNVTSRGELPRLPFDDDEFDLTLVSYLLFAYQARFDYEFHRESILEIMRVTRSEARIYPTVTLSTAERIHSNAAIRSGAAGF